MYLAVAFPIFLPLLFSVYYYISLVHFFSIHPDAELQKDETSLEKVAWLYKKLYEDNATGKVTDDGFILQSHRYEVERMNLKVKIAELQEHLNGLSSLQNGKEQFIGTVQKFMEMQKLTAPLLKELIDHIDVYEMESAGKNKARVSRSITLSSDILRYLIPHLPIITRLIQGRELQLNTSRRWQQHNKKEQETLLRTYKTRNISRQKNRVLIPDLNPL